MALIDNITYKPESLNENLTDCYLKVREVSYCNETSGQVVKITLDIYKNKQSKSDEKQPIDTMVYVYKSSDSNFDSLFGMAVISTKDNNVFKSAYTYLKQNFYSTATDG